MPSRAWEMPVDLPAAWSIPVISPSAHRCFWLCRKELELPIWGTSNTFAPRPLCWNPSFPVTELLTERWPAPPDKVGQFSPLSGFQVAISDPGPVTGWLWDNGSVLSVLALKNWPISFFLTKRKEHVDMETPSESDVLGSEYRLYAGQQYKPRGWAPSSEFLWTINPLSQMTWFQAGL